jgi:microcystin-dependent protein
MSDPFVGQIQSFGFIFAPRGWALCDGQLMAISQNPTLFSLLGTTYGGNGTSTFGLPDLRSRVPMHVGTSPAGNTYVQGEIGGEENVSILSSNLPSHNHGFTGTTATATSADPLAGSALASIASTRTADFYYASDATTQSLNSNSISTVGGNQPHTNIQPYLTINWCIALQGVYPSRG